MTTSLNPIDSAPFPPFEAYEAARSCSTNRFVDEDADALFARFSSWLVKGLWPLVGLCFLIAPSGAGKSFWIIHQVAMIAQGLPVLNRRSLKSAVVYVASEGANGVRARFQGLRKKLGPWDGMIRFISEAPNLRSDEDIDALLLRLTAIKASLAANDRRLGVVVIDTLSASIPGAEENSGKDMSLVLAALQKMAIDLQVCVIVVAHVGKDADRGIRGWSGQHANADGVIAIHAPREDGTRVGEVMKVKDGESGERFAFALDVVDLGEDDDGDPVTTCVVADRVVPVETKRTKQPTGPGAQAEMLVKAFERLETCEVPLFPGVRPNTRGVRLGELRAKVFGMGFHQETMPEFSDDALATARWKAARKKAFQRALSKLVELRTIRHEEDFVWLV